MSVTQFTLATVQTDKGPTSCLCVDNHFYPLRGLHPFFQHKSVKELLQEWPDAFATLQSVADAISTGESPRSSAAVPPEELRLLTPIMYPDNLFAVGANYADHLKEMGLAVKKWDSMPFFLRPPTSSLVGPGHTVQIPSSTRQFDWECELAVVVGKTLRHATPPQAASAIMGYSIGLDLSCRDLIPTDNELHVDLVRGKAQDTMAPCGPVVVPKEFVEDVNALRITLDVNSKRMMDSSTKNMLFKCDEMLSTISQYITLKPGDVVFTGSPPGSAAIHGGCWLKPKDHIHAEIENIGVLDVWMQE